MKVVTLAENLFKIQIKAVFVSTLFQFKTRYAALNEISYDNNFLMGIQCVKMETDPVLEFREAEDLLFCFIKSRPATRPTPSPSQWGPGLFSGGKATRAEANHSHPTNSTVQNQSTDTSSASVCLHVVDPGKFTFTDKLQREVAELSFKYENNPHFFRFSSFKYLELVLFPHVSSASSCDS